MDDSLKGFTVNWILVGLLFFCLLTFTFGFMFNNNTDGLGDDANTILSESRGNVSSKLLEVDDESNNLLNITAKTNPEASDLGSRDSVATGYGYKDSGVSFWTQLKVFIRWILAGDAGKILITVVSGLLGFLAVYYIWGWIKNGR